MHDEDTCCVDGCSEPVHVRHSRKFPHLSGACKYHYHAEASARPGLDLDPRDCAWCDTRFRPRRPIERCCSKKCSQGWSKYGCEDALLRRRVAALAGPVLVPGRQRSVAGPFVAASCPECLTPFVMTAAHARMGAVGGVRYCSLKCGKRAGRRNHRHRRRAGREGKRIYRTRVLERDGWLCRLCGEPLDMDAAVPHPRAPVLDHIVPLALGGEHAHYNVQAAHFMCNSHKRDLLDGQVALPVLSPTVRQRITMGDMQKSIRFPEGMAEEIQLVADAEDRTFSYVVVRAMERALGDATGDRIPERPAPPRSTSPDKPAMTRWEKKQIDGLAKSAPKALRRQKATDAMSAALARQQALNKPKGI